MNNDSGKKSSLYKLIERLYPICRSITGDGVRETLQIIKERIPLQILETPTGTKVFDWEVPKEWNINEAWIKNPNGEKIINFADSNLHVLNYSIPVDKKLSLDELKKHLHTLPEQPDLIPHKTSYFKKQWGFCLAHNQLMSLEEGTYHAYIDSTLEDGSLTHGELFIEGNKKEEVIISSHICHPSLCNDNLSGISIAVHLAEYLLEQQELNYSYRFLFIPATIGSINWLAHNEDEVKHIRYGLVLSCLGDPGETMTYKKSRKGDAKIDLIVMKALTDSKGEFEVQDFSPSGYDERQFCSPAFDLPVGLLMRTPHGEFPEYHTSADNLEFIKPEALSDSLSKLESIIYMIENNRKYLNLNPKCEPNLGKRGLYKLTGGKTQYEVDQMAILWVLNLSDGKHTLLDISNRANLNFKKIKKAAEALGRVNLLKDLS